MRKAWIRLLALFVMGGSVCALLPSASAAPSTAAKSWAETPPRLLVIVPHPDDESLVGTSIIEGVKKSGGQVQLVVMTNGDGFRKAAKRAFRVSTPKSEDLYRLGLLRQQEELSAAKRLGLQPQDIRFLGYPDAGLHHLWNTHWDADRPYKALNGHSRVPYDLAYHKSAPYCGQAIVGDLRRVMAEYRPTHVLYPDPHDVHRDHWATSAFTQFVLAGLPPAARPREWTFLVHYPDFPKPRSYRPVEALNPPAPLAHMDGVTWRKQPITRAQRSQKRTTILAHRSQVDVMHDLLVSFVRTNELVGFYSNPTVREVPEEERNALFTPGPLRHKLVFDPDGDQEDGTTLPAADLLSLSMIKIGDRMQLCAELADNVRFDLDYAIRLRLPNAPTPQCARIDFLVHQGKLQVLGVPRPLAEPTLQFWRNRLLITFPAALLQDDQTFLLSAEISKNDFTLDHSAWRKVDIQAKTRS